jgi:hypothetical protein
MAATHIRDFMSFIRLFDLPLQLDARLRLAHFGQFVPYGGRVKI